MTILQFGTAWHFGSSSSYWAKMLRLNHEFMCEVTNAHFYISSEDSENDLIKLSWISGTLSQNVDIKFNDLIQMRDTINNAIQEVFELNEICCPACGQTRDEAMLINDHKTCRKFPFFPGESGKSDAIAR